MDRADVRGGDGGRRRSAVRGIEQRRERDGLDATAHVLDGADDDDGAKVLEPSGRCGHGIEERILDDQDRRGGRVDEMLEERPAVVDVDRDLHGAEPGRCQPGEDELGAVAHHQQHAVAVSHPEPCEAGRDDVHLRHPSRHR